MQARTPVNPTVTSQSSTASQGYSKITDSSRIVYDGEMPVLHIPGISKRRYPPAWLLIIFATVALWLLRRAVVLWHLRRKYVRDDLPGDIAKFYDLRSAAWESVWGEHMHHGLYDKVHGRVVKGVDAQIRTMSELLVLARTHGGSILTPAHGAQILDVGCGIGGASRFLARAFGPEAHVNGITLSPRQQARATELNAAQNFRNVTIDIENAHATSFDDGFFDLVWSLESAEHMDDKKQFISECTRVLRPGAPFVMLAWCIRESSPPLNTSERFAIRKIMEYYCLPRLAPPSEYETEMLRAGLHDIYVEDWTERAAPFWDEVVRSAVFNRKGLAALFKYGWPLLRSAVTARHVIRGIRLGTFRLVAFTGRKLTELEARERAKLELKC